MGDIYLLTIVLAVYFYMDKEKDDKNIRWMNKRPAVNFSIAASVWNTLVVIKKKYLLFIRFIKRVTYDDFDIPRFSFDKKIFSPAF